MAITVNNDLCIGCGACASICPSTFKMNDEGKSEPLEQEDKPCAVNAAESCPAQAISVN
jgi:ferredoxin